jgi:hypothetical protein
MRSGVLNIDGGLRATSGATLCRAAFGPHRARSLLQESFRLPLYHVQDRVKIRKTATVTRHGNVKA